MHIKWLAARHIIARVISQIFPQCLYYARSEARDVIISINFSKNKTYVFCPKKSNKVISILCNQNSDTRGENY